MKIAFFLLLIMFTISTYSQDKVNNGYLKYIDSASTIYDDRPELAITYLDSIPEPIEMTLKGHLADYFRVKGLISDRLNNTAELFQNSIMALKYAKIEGNNNIAGLASIDLFYNTYFIKEDSTAFRYLREAEVYFKKDNNINGQAETNQMYAYVELFEGNYAKSNALILEHLSEYENIKDDGYYNMYALFMLSSNYIHQGDLNNSHKYFNRLNALTQDSTIPKYLHDVHKVSINTCIAEYHLSKQTMDSTLYYLKKAEELRYAMNSSDVELYFKSYADYYEHFEDLEGRARYIDSLSNFQAKLLEKNMIAILKINESLEKSESLLDNESRKKYFNRNLAIIIFSVLCILLIVFIVNYKKFKKIIKGYISTEKKSKDLQSNHEKLKVKVVGLEQYILKIKDEVKTISSVTDSFELKKNIKELYKKIHLKSSTELMSGENHLELINNLNVEFFTKIKDIYPQLNESEIIICYYLFTGFKNKEIASFLNVSVRSVESKRYRINKKLEIKTKQITLVEHLQNVFS